MKIEIESHDHNGRTYFEFVLQDGPGNRERVRGYATDLIVAFTKVIEWHERIEREYRDAQSLPPLEATYNEAEADDPALETYLNSETNRVRV
jgi:hypothetical protein